MMNVEPFFCVHYFCMSSLDCDRQVTDSLTQRAFAHRASVLAELNCSKTLTTGKYEHTFLGCVLSLRCIRKRRCRGRLGKDHRRDVSEKELACLRGRLHCLRNGLSGGGAHSHGACEAAGRRGTRSSLFSSSLKIC